MARDVTTLVATGLESRYIRPALFINLTFATSTQYVWTGVGSVQWNGNTYLGVGELGSISAITEGSKVQAEGISLTLSGIPINFLTDVETEILQGLPVQVYLALFDENTQIIPDPICAYSGLMDQPTIEIGTDKLSVTIAIENKMINLQRAQNRRYTDADQRMDYPADDAFLFIERLQDSNFKWT